jgi:TatD family-associated radical SAM protein
VNTRVEIMAKHPINGPEQIVYDVGDRRFIEVTRRCNLDCRFCPFPQRQGPEIPVHQMSKEPSLTNLIDTACASGHCREVVFAGVGEPTYRLYDILKAARYLQNKRVRVVLNTNGLADRIHHRQVAPDFEDNVDEVNISLSAYDNKSYESLCCPTLDGAFESVLEFVECAKEYIPTVNIMCASQIPGVEPHRVRDLADRLGVGFRESRPRHPC